MLIINKEWSSKVSQDVSYSLVLRVLRNGGFIHLRTQSDVNEIRKPLSKQEQDNHLTWIKARSHYGFRTGAELILLSEAGIHMASFDRSDSTKKIDELGQTIVADSWGFNRLSNSLRRNGDGERGRLSREWEEAIKVKFKDMSVERRTAYILLYNPTSRRTVPDIRIWTLTDFQRFCRRNANSDGNLVDEISGVELTPETFAVDRVINGTVAGLSGEYRNEHCLITHRRINDMKEADGRKVYATVETLTLEMQRRNINQVDFRIATQLIVRDFLTTSESSETHQCIRKT
ncbi:hypothetical protein HDU78_008013 [Chytriomyces hyalinus]|nr:hypothetical protein HDU78_008013 [Chytriomyces hyalinus]